MDTNVKTTLEAAIQELTATAERLAPLMDQLRPITQAAQTAHNYGITTDMTADQIIDFFAHRVNIEPPQVAMVASVLSAGAPREIEKAGQALLATYRQIGTLLGQLTGTVLAMK